jgi:hypothetical protein
MPKQRFELERPSVFRDTVITAIGGLVTFIGVSYLFSGFAGFLVFLAFAFVVYFLSRR